MPNYLREHQNLSLHTSCRKMPQALKSCIDEKV